MKSLIIFALSCAVLLGQSGSVLESYRIPEYSYHNLILFGQDFAKYSKKQVLESYHQKEEKIQFNLGFVENVVIQDSMKTRIMNGIFDLSHELNHDWKSWTEDKRTTIGLLQMQVMNNWYLSDQRGMFVYADPGILYAYDFKQSLKLTLADINLGFGYGRVIDIKPLVQSYMISKELNLDLSDASLIEIAQLIEKYNNGVFSFFNRDEAKIEFFKEINMRTGRADAAVKIDQILNSGLYKVSERKTGWEVKFGANAALSLVENILPDYSQFKNSAHEENYDLFASSNYAFPLDFNKQFLFGLEYNRNLNRENKDGRYQRIGLKGQFSIEHTFNWESKLSITYQKLLPDENPYYSNVFITARTDYLLMNSASVYLNVFYSRESFQEISRLKWAPYIQKIDLVEGIDIHFGFNIYLL